MATLPLKSSHNEHRAVIRFRGQKDLPHLLYSPDLAPSDYRLFGPMKKMLNEQKFASDTKMQSVAHHWLGQQPASFFASGIQKLVDRWDKCLNELGRYVETLCLTFKDIT